MSRKRKTNFLKNKDATAEIIGTVLAIVILIFFFGNVFLWSNEVNKISDQIKWDKMNSPVRIEPIYEIGIPNGGNNKILSHFEVVNQGGVDASLSRLWILNSSDTGDANDHIFADLEPLNVWVSAGNKKVIKLNTTTVTNIDGSLVATISDSEIIIFYEPPQGYTLTFKILTTTGNTAACSIETDSVITVSGFDYVDSEYVLPGTGLGADYLLYYSNDDVSVWTATEFTRDGEWYYGHIDLVNFWKPLFHQVKLGFTFPSENQICSYYEYDKMNAVIQMFADRETPVIPALYPKWDSEAYVGSDKLVQDWIGFTNAFLDDERIAAFNIFGEPVGAIDNGQGTNLIQWHPDMEGDKKNVLLYFVDLVNTIHSIDPDRKVIFPFMGLSYWDQNEMIADLEGTGMLENPNVIFDIIHPYYFENPEWNEGTPTEKVAMYETQFIVPWANRLPSTRLWCGETFCFSMPASETNYNPPTRTLQVEFMTNMINVFVEYKIGFNFWDSLSYPPYYTSPLQVFSQSDAHIESVKASNYGLTIINPQ